MFMSIFISTCIYMIKTEEKFEKRIHMNICIYSIYNFRTFLFGFLQNTVYCVPMPPT
jgi:hypothetical protein